MRVVMVDDGAAERKFYRMLLEESHGPNVDFCEAVDGNQGLELCRALPPDCVLLDYKLPDMSGLEFLAHLGKNSNADPMFPVVILTGVASEHSAVAALKAGAQDYLVKDRVTAESLSLALEKATGKVSLIRELRAERDRLAASLAEKEVLLKEVHHRVKNNLQVIVSLLRLQSEGLEDAGLAAVLRESQNRVEAMALIHEQLYETTDLREVDLASHAEMLAHKLLHSYGVDSRRIGLRFDFPPLPLAVDQAIPAGLILNELISNVLKHAFPNGRRGALSIAGSRGLHSVVLEVSDDGIGLPQQIDAIRPKSLGLEIVNILTRQLKGTVEANREAGTSFRVTFPSK